MRGCRYAGVPVANLGEDVLVSVSDTIFARTLTNAGHLLWLKDPSLPELAAGAPLDPALTMPSDPIDVNNACAFDPYSDIINTPDSSFVSG